jgi:hypothetical protein
MLGLAIVPFLLVSCIQYATFKRLIPLMVVACAAALLSTLVIAIVEGVSCNQISNWAGSDQIKCGENFVATQTFFYPFFVLGVLQVWGAYKVTMYSKQHNLAFGSYFLLSTPFKVLLWLVILLVVAVDCLSFILPFTAFQMLDGDDFIASAPFGWNS